MIFSKDHSHNTYCRIMSILVILLTAAMAAVILSSCASKPESLEEYAESNSEISERISSSSGSSNVKIDIKGNDIIYTYDLASVEGYTEEVVQNEEAVRALEDALDKTGSNFGKVCSDVESVTELSGIKVTVNYIFKDKVIVSRSFTSEDASSEDASSETEKKGDSEGSGSSDETE